MIERDQQHAEHGVDRDRACQRLPSHPESFARTPASRSSRPLKPVRRVHRWRVSRRSVIIEP
jgi:hypothetical protein